MGLPQTQSPAPTHLYPQDIQLKLYQAFIFSIPILFSIILFLLFYLFYLKRRASTLSQPPPILPASFNRTNALVLSNCQLGLKRDLKDRLPTVLFDEELRARDAQCCVCLGEFELKEQLLQIPTCKHVFHGDCIRHWLYSHLTCPLCRCSVLSTTTIVQNPVPASLTVPLHHHNTNNTTSNASDNQQIVSSEV
ncbi:hypothetical protein SLA2020_464340 [Shorea laevis]